MLRILHYITLFYVIFLTMLLWLPEPRVILYGWEPSEGAVGYAHLITFTILGYLVELGRQKKTLLFWIFMLVLYTFGTEIVQALTAPIFRWFELPVRSFDFQDIFQDLCGGVLGIILAALPVALHKTKKNEIIEISRYRLR